MGWEKGLAPREKLVRLGAESLTDAELLAIFLRTGLPGVHVMQLAEGLLAHFGSLYQLMMADQSAFQNAKGVGISKYTQIKAISELSRRLFFSRLAKEDAMLNPEATGQYLQFLLSRREREVFLVLFLDNQHHVIRHQEMFVGTINSVEVHPREIVREALKANAAALI